MQRLSSGLRRPDPRPIYHHQYLRAAAKPSGRLQPTQTAGLRAAGRDL